MSGDRGLVTYIYLIHNDWRDPFSKKSSLMPHTHTEVVVTSPWHSSPYALLSKNLCTCMFAP